MINKTEIDVSESNLELKNLLVEANANADPEQNKELENEVIPNSSRGMMNSNQINKVQPLNDSNIMKIQGTIPFHGN